jgi:hypothetical protein
MAIISQNLTHSFVSVSLRQNRSVRGKNPKKLNSVNIKKKQIMFLVVFVYLVEGKIVSI